MSIKDFKIPEPVYIAGRFAGYADDTPSELISLKKEYEALGVSAAGKREDAKACEALADQMEARRKAVEEAFDAAVKKLPPAEA